METRIRAKMHDLFMAKIIRLRRLADAATFFVLNDIPQGV